MPIYDNNDICGYEGPIVVGELDYMTTLTEVLIDSKYTVVIYSNEVRKNNESFTRPEYYIYYKPKES